MGKGNFSLGQRIIAKAPCHCAQVEYTAPVGGGDINIDRATLLAAVEAKVGLTAPAGTTFDLQNATVAVYSKGTEVIDNGTQVETVTSLDDAATVTCNALDVAVNPYGGNKPFGNDVYDEDCDGDSDNVLAADFNVLIPEGSAVAIYACITPVS